MSMVRTKSLATRLSPQRRCSPIAACRWFYNSLYYGFQPPFAACWPAGWQLFPSTLLYRTVGVAHLGPDQSVQRNASTFGSEILRLFLFKGYSVSPSDVYPCRLNRWWRDVDGIHLDPSDERSRFSELIWCPGVSCRKCYCFSAHRGCSLCCVFYVHTSDAMYLHMYDRRNS